MKEICSFSTIISVSVQTKMRFIKPHPEEERKLPAIEAHSEKLGFNPLLFNDVVIVCSLHFLPQKHKHTEESVAKNYLITNITESSASTDERGCAQVIRTLVFDIVHTSHPITEDDNDRGS